MRLELARHVVQSLEFGRRTAFEDGRLVVDRDEIRALVLGDPNVRSVEIEIVRPGDRVRIVHCMDVVEPRAKASGSGEVFPGFLGPPVTVGSGRTVVLTGVAIVSTGTWPELTDPWWSNREAIIDMGGSASRYSPYSRTRNLVLSFRTAAGLTPAQQDHAIRVATLRVARHLALTARDRSPDEVETCELGQARGGLPRVAYICHLGSLGALYNTYLYGHSVAGTLPTLIHPNELFDGAVVNGHHRLASERHPTYDHQNSPVATELMQRHGRDLNFVGVILMRSLAELPEEKERLASYTAKLAKLLGAEAAVITRQGGGHAIFDLMTTCQRCEQVGIKTALLVNEMAGHAGTDVSMIDFVPEADLMVSAGNHEALIDLPALDRAVGGDVLLGMPGRAVDARRLQLRWVFGANSQLGVGCLTARAR
ncbi:MAG TPA: glycine/sarcosine/betaine reductase component B subunit [Thermodesulfobacteriota bacterium]